jgi:hypothetical protein
MLPFFVSERVVQNLKEEEIPFRRAIEIPVTSIECTALKNIPPPKYYILEAEIGILMGEIMKDVPIAYVAPGKMLTLPAGSCHPAPSTRKSPRWPSPSASRGRVTCCVTRSFPTASPS